MVGDGDAVRRESLVRARSGELNKAWTLLHGGRRQRTGGACCSRGVLPRSEGPPDSPDSPPCHWPHRDLRRRDGPVTRVGAGILQVRRACTRGQAQKPLRRTAQRPLSSKPWLKPKHAQPFLRLCILLSHSYSSFPRSLTACVLLLPPVCTRRRAYL